MIPRYTREKMGSIWTDKFKYETWLKIEVLACEKLTQLKEIPEESFKDIKSKASFDLDEMKQIEEEVKHDVIAFLTSVAKAVGPSSRYIHMGLTSSDVIDTAFAYQLSQACDRIIKEAGRLEKTLRDQSEKYKMVPIMGRTHGMHAEPTSVGMKFLLFANEMKRNLKRLAYAREEIAVGKLSGAVGTFAHIKPDVEVYVCEKLGLKAAPVSTQVIQRDRHAQLFTTLAILGGTLEKIAIEIRHLQRTEVGEIGEGFAKGQKGSSAMPHKKNPIGCENITGVARLLRSNAVAALENIALWHERDISHSSVERVIAPDSTILADYALHRMTNIVKNLNINEQRMAENIQLSKGMCFSGQVLIELTKENFSREDAYRIVQQCAMKAYESNRNLKEILMENIELIKKLGGDKLQGLLNRSFDIQYYLKTIPELFERSKNL